jgi:transketolase
VLNVASIKPLDVEAVLKAAGTGLIVTAEDHNPDTGLGARVATVIADAGVACRVIRLGVKAYGLSGKPEDLYRLEGLDKEGIITTVLEAQANGWLKN